jgi:hypothetical protein
VSALECDTSCKLISRFVAAIVLARRSLEEEGSRTGEIRWVGLDVVGLETCCTVVLTFGTVMLVVLIWWCIVFEFY